MKYVMYDAATGGIFRWGEGLEPPPPFPGETILDHEVSGDLSGYRVNLTTLVLEPKTLVTPAVPGPTPADGVTEAVVSGLPAGTMVTILTPTSNHLVQVDDGTLEVAYALPGTLSLRMFHRLHTIPDVTLEFV